MIRYQAAQTNPNTTLYSPAQLTVVSSQILKATLSLHDI